MRKSDEQERSGLVPVILLLVLVLLAAAAFGGWRIAHMPRGAKPTLGEGEFRIGVEGDRMTLTWAEPSNADLLRIYRLEEETGQYALYGEYTQNSTVLSDVEDGKALRLKFQAVRYTTNLLGEPCESASDAQEATVIPVELDCPALTVWADPEKKSATLSWEADEKNRYELYYADEGGRWQLFGETQEGSVSLQFGADGDFDLPGREEPLALCVQAIRSGDGCLYYGTMSDAVTVEREELLGEDPLLTYTETGDNTYDLHWEETRGAQCELQRWSEEEEAWVTLGLYDWSDSLSYETGHLPSCAQQRFRVIVYDSVEQKEADIFAAGPSEISFWTQTSPLYCTVWPVIGLELYEDAQGDEVADEVPAGMALCVLGEENGRFSVRYQGTYGYVDAGYCMINLPEYLGDLCEYNITNSYDSIFRVHEYDIPEITGTVIDGYEAICLENDDLLVPYLYPCADRLLEAAKQVWEDGYCLRIYDAFRPNEATRYLYDTVSELLDTPVETEEEEEGETAEGKEPEEPKAPEEPETEEEDLTRYERATRAKEEKAERERLKQEEGDDMPEGAGEGKGMAEGKEAGPEEGLEAGMEEWMPEEIQNAWLAALAAGLAKAREAGLIADVPEGEEEAPKVTLEEFLMGLTQEQLEIFAAGGYVPGMENIILEEPGPTYREVMTNGTFKLSAFLAAVTSAHNRGIALDLTLVERNADEELPMQTQMHDLSWNAILALNNDNAKLLSEYMLGVGFRGLSSEWWHFQDDETREELQLNSYLAKGVAVTGWKKDDFGWKYRQEDGSFLRSTTATVEGETVTFDEDGYAQ